jgi:hypothetical protein
MNASCTFAAARLSTWSNPSPLFRAPLQVSPHSQSARMTTASRIGRHQTSSPACISTCTTEEIQAGMDATPNRRSWWCPGVTHRVQHASRRPERNKGSALTFSHNEKAVPAAPPCADAVAARAWAAASVLPPERMEPVHLSTSRMALAAHQVQADQQAGLEQQFRRNRGTPLPISSSSRSTAG